MNAYTDCLAAEFALRMLLAQQLTVQPTEHEKAEWSRMAQAAYASDQNTIGHRFSTAASLPRDSRMPLAEFDSLQRDYRAWLCFSEWE